MGHSKALLLRHMPNPATPPAGASLLYAKSDGKAYTKDSSGAEVEVGVDAFAVIAASTGNVSISSPPATIDGVTVPTTATGEVVLLKDQTAPAENGIYTPSGVGSLTRVSGWTSMRYTGAVVRVLSGTVNGGTLWATSGWTTSSVVGTTAQSWVKLGAASGSAAVVPVQTSEPASPTTGQMFFDSDEPSAVLGEFVDMRLTTDYTTTTPAAPATGLRHFARHRARRIPAVIGPSGMDTQLQPALFSNRIARINVINNTATPQFDGIAVTNRATAPAAVAVAVPGFFTSMVRARYASIATAGNAGGFRSTTAQWFTSPTANMGGMFMVCRFGLNAITATNRFFLGFSSATADLNAAVNPSTLLNQFGFAADSTHTTFRFMHNDGTGACTAIDLGANFPCQTAATYFYEFRIFVPSGVGNQVYWSAHRLNDGLVVQGGPITTDLPASQTLMAFHLMHSNGTTASAVSTDLQSLYIETDN